MGHLIRLLVLLCCVNTVFAVTVSALADINGNSAIQQFSTSVVGQVALWVEVVCPSANMGTVRLGSLSSPPSSTVGVPCAAGGAQFYPPIPVSPGVFSRYDLSTLTFFAASGSSVSISYAQ
jgi:hypothetical protein